MTAALRTWKPDIGAESRNMLARTGLPDAAQRQVLGEAQRVLSRCIDPRAWGRKESSAELVVGEVQSGKTVSFTALTALAHDNGFPLVIVLAGTKKNLMHQTLDRLKRDLKMEGDGGLPTWRAISLDGAPVNADELTGAITAWQAHPDWHQRTTVAVILKNRSRLDQARNLMRELTAHCGEFPTLIIDDEGDQAGLNLLVRKRDESSTYRAIRELREVLPLHSYVMYTATPQAPLLVAMTDTVSPRTVTVLTSGNGYIGGEDLFLNRKGVFDHEIMDIDEALDADRIAPPLSLQQALATYLVALVISQMRGRPRPLSMLIHPSATKDLHQTYEAWVRAIIRNRLEVALESGDEHAVEQVSRTLLRPAYDELARTGGTDVQGHRVDLETIIKHLPKLLANVRIQVINSEDGIEIEPNDWTSHPGWILIGGSKLDRGFTVENLAITYMPRGPGTKNADTIQQRGRFFGYRGDYSNLLRAWLNPDTAKVYRQYVYHERQMQRDLRYYDEHGRPLSEWRRQFLLDPSMNLTREQVIGLDLGTVKLSQGWILSQTHLHTEAAGPSEEGARTLQHLFEQAQTDSRDARPGAQHHNVRVSVPWREIAPVIADWRAVPDDRSRLEALLLSTAETNVSNVDLIFMDELDPRARRLEARGQKLVTVPKTSVEAEKLQISQLFQGRSGQYIGDKAFRSRDRITIQVHRVVPERIGPYGGKPVEALAIYLPRATSDIIRQR